MEQPSFRAQQREARIQRYSLRRSGSLASNELTDANKADLERLRFLEAYRQQYSGTRPSLNSLRLDMVATVNFHRQYFPELESYKGKLQEIKHKPLRFNYEHKSGNGIVFVAGGVKYLTNVWMAIKTLRYFGCNLPVEIWYLDEYEMPVPFKKTFQTLTNVHLRNAAVQAIKGSVETGWQLKSYALINSHFANVFFFDADTVVHRDPSFVFASKEFTEHGAIFWPDIRKMAPDRLIWEICGVPPTDSHEVEAGQMVLDTKTNPLPLEIGLFMNEHREFFYRHLWGDKDTLPFAWRMCNRSFFILDEYKHLNVNGRFSGIRHIWTDREPLIDHRIHCKWDISLLPQIRTEGSPLNTICEEFMNELRFLVSTNT